MMKTAHHRKLTLAEAARRLGLSVDALLELVYKGELPARVQPSTGRLLLDEDDVEHLRSQRQERPG